MSKRAWKIIDGISIGMGFSGFMFGACCFTTTHSDCFLIPMVFGLIGMTLSTGHLASLNAPEGK